MAVEHAVADTGDNGERLFLSALTTINRAIAWTCARNHVSHEDAEEFGSHVRLKLIEENYAIIRKFQGRSALRTYLTVVIQRLFLDFRISAWGKWRPSAEAKRGGALAMLLEQLLVRDGHTFDEACQLLATKYGIAAEDAELERVASRFPMRVKRRFESDDRLVEMPTAVIDGDELLMTQDRQATADRTGDVVSTVMAALEVEDRLILRLRFDDGRTVAEIAALLRLEQKALYRRIERLLKQLRTALEAHGLDCAAVFEMLESPAVSIEWRRETEDPAVRPSMVKGTQEWR